MALPTFDPPPDVALGRPFWGGVAEGQLRLPRCSTCQRWQWYPDEVGPCCPGADYQWVPVSGTGSLYTITTVRRPFLPDGDADAPYAVGLIELDDVPGARLVGNLDPDTSWTIGDRVRITFVRHGPRRHPLFVVPDPRDDEVRTPSPDPRST